MQGFTELTSEEAQAVEGGGRLRYILYKVKRRIKRILYRRRP